MLKLFASLLILVSMTDCHYDLSFTRISQSALEFRTRTLQKFKGIPKISQLESDEKRELFHYGQTVAIRDSGKDDDKVRRCEVFSVYEKGKRKKILSKLKKLLNVDVKEASMDKMMDLLKDCDSVDNNIEQEPEQELEPDENPILNGILPGTNWCGFGNIAESYHDLGKLRNVDRCCRSHDLCPIDIVPKDNVHNLTNEAVYTKSHCRCDETFYNCLKKDCGWSAKLIGNLYFYVAKPQCIKGVPEKPDEGMEFIPAPKKW